MLQRLGAAPEPGPQQPRELAERARGGGELAVALERAGVAGQRGGEPRHVVAAALDRAQLGVRREVLGFVLERAAQRVGREVGVAGDVAGRAREPPQVGGALDGAPGLLGEPEQRAAQRGAVASGFGEPGQALPAQRAGVGRVEEQDLLEQPRRAGGVAEPLRVQLAGLGEQRDALGRGLRLRRAALARAGELGVAPGLPQVGQQRPHMATTSSATSASAASKWRRAASGSRSLSSASCAGRGGPGGPRTGVAPGPSPMRGTRPAPPGAAPPGRAPRRAGPGARAGRRAG